MIASNASNTMGFVVKQITTYDSHFFQREYSTYSNSRWLFMGINTWLPVGPFGNIFFLFDKDKDVYTTDDV
jgi:hypothetical protein